MFAKFLSLICLKLLLAATLSSFLQAADSSNVFAIFRSEDRGRTWSRSDAGLPGTTRINALAASGESMFAGTDSGVFRSRDQGRNWKSLTNAKQSRITNLTSIGNQLFVGTDGDGLLVTADQGETWSANQSFPIRKVRSLFGRAETLYVGTDSDGVFASSDRGQNWNHLDQGLPPNAQVSAMSAVNGKLFAGLYSKGLYSLSEADQRWIKTGDVAPLALAAVGETLIAGHNPGGIFSSDDLGRSWSHWTGNFSPEFLLGLPGDNAGLSREAPVWDLAADGNIAFAGVSQGIYFSEDRGRTWTRATAGLPPVSPGVSFLVKKDLVLAGALIGNEGR